MKKPTFTRSKKTLTNCRWCDAPLAQHPRKGGRVREYCSTVCRVAGNRSAIKLPQQDLFRLQRAAIFLAAAHLTTHGHNVVVGGPPHSYDLLLDDPGGVKVVTVLIEDARMEFREVPPDALLVRVYLNGRVASWHDVDAQDEKRAGGEVSTGP